MSMFKGSSIGQKLVLDKSGYSRGLKEAKAEAREFGAASRQSSAMASKAFGLLGTAVKVGAVAGIAALVVTVHEGIDRLNELQKANAQTAAVLKSTGGAARVTGEHIQGMSEHLARMSGINSTAIQSGENMLLTFTRIRNGVGKNNKVYDQATKATLDMSVAMHTDMTHASIMVGKALNDPVKGLTKLQKVGVTFTDQQKKQITAMEKAGNTMGAQKVIIAELNREFGGSAKAFGFTMAGQIGKAKEAYADLSATLVRAFLPAFTAGLAKVNQWVAAARKWADSKQGQQTLKSLADGAKAAGAALQRAGTMVLHFGVFLAKHRTTVKALAITIISLVAAYKTFKVISTATKTIQDLTLRMSLFRSGMNGAKVSLTGLTAEQKAANAAGTKWGKLLGGIKSAAMSAATGIKGMASAALLNVRAAAANAAAAVRTAAAWTAEKVSMIAGAVATKAAAAATALMTGAQWLLNAAMEANPLVLITTLIIAAGVAIYVAYQKIGWFHNAVNAAWSLIKEGASIVRGAFMAVVNAVVSGVTTAVGFVRNHWKLILALIGGPIVAAVVLVASHWNQIRSAVSSGVNAVLSFVRSHWKTILTLLGGPLGAAVALVASNFGRIKSAVSAAVSFVTGVVKKIPGVVSSIAGAIGSAATAAFNGIKTAFQAVINWIDQQWKSVTSKLSAVTSAASKIGSLASKIPGIQTGGVIVAGGVRRYATGGLVPGSGSGDKVPAMLEPGEGIINRNAVAALGGPGVVHAINRMVPRFASGGVAGDVASNIRSALNRLKVSNSPTLQLASAHTALVSSAQTQARVRTAEKVETDRIAAIKDELKHGKHTKAQTAALNKELKSREEAVKKLRQRETDLDGQQKDLGDTIVDLEAQMKEQAHQDALERPKTMLQLVDAQNNLARAQAALTDSKDDDAAAINASIKAEQDRQAAIQKAITNDATTDAERADLTNQMADSVTTMGQLQSDLKDLSSATQEVTTTITTAADGTTTTTTATADQSAITQAITDALKDTLGNVLQPTTHVENLEMKFTQPVNPMTALRALTYRLQQAG